MTKTITITLDDDDDRHVAQAIAFRQGVRDGQGCIIDQGESCLTGALIAEICRGWLEMHGQLPPITLGDVVASLSDEKRLAGQDGAVLIALMPSDEGGWTAGVDDTMPGCVSEGETIPETLRNLAEAVELWQSKDDE